MAQVELAHKKDLNRTKIVDLVTKTMFGDGKSWASTSPDSFWKSVKTCSKWFASPNFFFTLSLTMAQVQIAQKKEPNWTKIDDFVTQTTFGGRKN